MSIIDDILKALDRIPVWKRVSALPAEVDALKKRVEALEARLAPVTGDRCPKCRAMAFTLDSSGPMPVFADLGVRQYTYKCMACGYTDVKTQMP
jgi:predicted nucleic-acid-binding Zn-ribbon protein